jgi:hypothetical protein
MIFRLEPHSVVGVQEPCRTAIEAFQFPQVGRVTVSIGYTKIGSSDAGSDAFGLALTPRPAYSSTRYFSMSSPASCLRLSHVAIRPRPDHVSFVRGSRYFGFSPAAGSSWCW